MTDAMKFMEELRKEQREGQPIGFVTMSSENPNSVGLAGAADPDASYNWTKRRNNMPSTKRDGNGPPKSYTEY